MTDGVRIDLGLKNVSEGDANIGMRYIFDTYLGESKSVHFRTDTLRQLTHELTLTPADKALYWVSPLVGDADEMGLEVMLGPTGGTVPDKVVFANWKRLSDAPWGYDTSLSRNFSLLPYSVNDSAVSEYFDPRPIAKGAERTITLALGKFTQAGFSVAAAPAAQASSARVSSQPSPRVSNRRSLLPLRLPRTPSRCARSCPPSTTSSTGSTGPSHPARRFPKTSSRNWSQR